MARDVYLVRSILGNLRLGLSLDIIPGYDADTIGRHLELLRQGGFINADSNTLTWRGHELAGALGNEVVWGHLNERFSGLDLASMPIGVLEHMARELTAQWAKKKAGL